MANGGEMAIGASKDLKGMIFSGYNQETLSNEKFVVWKLGFYLLVHKLEPPIAISQPLTTINHQHDFQKTRLATGIHRAEI